MAALLLATPLLATDYYFSPTGNDTTGNGTLGNPYATTAKASQLDLAPGDRVLFEGGKTFKLMDAATVTSGELLTNPGFENGLASWSPWAAGDATVVSSPVKSGASAVKLVGTAGSYPGMFQQIPTTGLNPGDILVMSCWVRMTAENGQPNTTTIAAGIKASLGGVLQTQFFGDANAKRTTLLGGWVKITGAIMLPEQFDNLEVWCYHDGGMEVVFDDFSVQRIAGGGPLVLVGDDDGAANNRVIVGSYGTGRATLDAGLLPAIQIEASYLEIRDLNLVGQYSDDFGTQHGISALGRLGSQLTDLTLRDIDITGFGGNGVRIDNAPGGTGPNHNGYTGVLVERVNVANNRNDGIYVDGWFENTNGPYAHFDLVIRGCRATGNVGFEGRHSGSGILVGDSQNVLIEHCYAYGNGAGFLNPGKGGPIGIWAWDSDNVVIQFCESAGNISSGIDGGGFDLDGGCTDSVIQYCYSHDNEGSGFCYAHFSGSAPTKNNAIRYSISVNDGTTAATQGAINFWGAVQNSTVHNLLVIGGANSSPLMVRESNGSGNKVFNNIFIALNANKRVFSSAASTDITYRNNLFWNIDGSAPRFNVAGTVRTGVAAFEAALPAATNNLEANPLLQGPLSSTAPSLNGATELLPLLQEYALQTGSPAIDAGLDPQAVYGLNPGAQDYQGAVIPAGTTYDVGAMESSGLLTNGHLESVLTPWSDWGNTSRQTGSAHWGTGALRTGTGAGGAGNTVTTALVPGASYRLTAWARRTTTDAAYVGVTLKNGGVTLVNEQLTVASTAYQQYVLEFTAPAQFDNAYVWTWKDAGTGYLWADDFHLVKLSAPLAPPLPAALSRWNFESNANDTATGGASANTATLVNGAGYSTTQKAVGTASLTLDAATKQHASVANHADLNPTSAITVAAWIRPADLVNWRRVLQKGANGAQYRIETNATGGGKFCLKVGATSHELVIPNGTFTIGAWKHVVGTYDGATIRCYVDGVSVGTPISATGAIATTTSPLLVGARIANDTVTTTYWNGQVDDVRIYGVALTSAEVSTLFSGN